MPGRLRLTDVSPRDGLQNEPGTAPAEGKAALVRLLCACGVDEVEVSSFVSSKWVPQLGDAAEVFALLAQDKPAGIVYSALVPNERGLARALEVNDDAGRRLIDKVSVFTAASESFSLKNTNATIDETIERFRPVVAGARGAGLAVRGYISCAVACPYEGPIPAESVATVAERLLELGVEEIDLGDTIGAAEPNDIDALLTATMGLLAERESTLTLHLHDTRGRAGACARAAMELGVRSFDAAVGGVGGCPFASTPGRRAPGNVDTGVILDAAESLGITHAIDRGALSKAADHASFLVAAARRSAAGGAAP